MGFMQMIKQFLLSKILLGGGVAYGVSGLFIRAHLSLKCRLRHLYHPQGSTGTVPKVL